MNNKRIKLLINRRKKIDDEITQIKNTCEHKKITAVAKSSSVYAETTEYWFDCTCVECGTQFYVDQDKRKYFNGVSYVKSEFGTHEILKVN